MSRLIGVFKWIGISTIMLMLVVGAALLFGAEVPWLVFQIGAGLVVTSSIGYMIGWLLAPPPPEEK